MAHGAGGRETSELIEKLLVPMVPQKWRYTPEGRGLDLLDDAALIRVGKAYLAVTIDSYTVKPVFFPGGDIGKLAASGTINDLLMVGAKPMAMVDAIVVEEGFSLDDLSRIVKNFVETATSEGVAIIGGDFKTMPREQLDGIIITVAGIGYTEKPITDDNIKPGDKIIVSGPLGDHGAAILAAQQGLDAEMNIVSDVKPLTRLMLPLLERYADVIHGASDPTRGGLAMLVNDWAKKTNTVIVVYEERIPVRQQVKSYAEMLGIDPLSLASEGVAVLAVEGTVADELVEYVRSLGFEEATVIGEVYEAREPSYAGTVLLRTSSGGVRILEPPSGELVPRIC